LALLLMLVLLLLLPVLLLLLLQLLVTASLAVKGSFRKVRRSHGTGGGGGPVPTCGTGSEHLEWVVEGAPSPQILAGLWPPTRRQSSLLLARGRAGCCYCCCCFAEAGAQFEEDEELSRTLGAEVVGPQAVPAKTAAGIALAPGPKTCCRLSTVMLLGCCYPPSTRCLCHGCY